MKTEMTKRERIMTALSNKEADRIPVAPDVSYMIPCKYTGKPFPEVLYRQNPPLWKAYLNVVDYFDFDGWFMYGAIHWKCKSQVTQRYYEEKDEYGRLMTVQEIDTPAGPLRQKILYPDYDCETVIEKVIKNLKDDLPKIRYLFPEIEGYDDSVYQIQKKELGEKGMMGIGIYPPGFQSLLYFFDGNVETMTYAYYDEPELFHELCSIYEKDQLRKLEMVLELKPDSILTGGSGSITLQSPELFDTLALPAIRKITRMCKEAGVLSGIHSCGKEMHLIRRCAEETDLDYVNPLEIPPMGDSTLAEAKRLYGGKLALMGNLHTTDIMLRGSVRDVRRESLKAMLDAGINGGFVLSTGDQPGRDTPEENLCEMIRVCKEFGAYPLDTDMIRAELGRL